MPLHTIREQQQIRLIFDGALTIYEAQSARRSLIEALVGAHSVDVDLAGISEIDVAGIQLLLTLLSEPNIRFQRNVSTAVSGALRLLGIEQLLLPVFAVPEA